MSRIDDVSIWNRHDTARAALAQILEATQRLLKQKPDLAGASPPLRDAFNRVVASAFDLSQAVTRYTEVSGNGRRDQPSRTSPAGGQFDQATRQHSLSQFSSQTNRRSGQFDVPARRSGSEGVASAPVTAGRSDGEIRAEQEARARAGRYDARP